MAVHIRDRYRPAARELQVAALIEAVPTLPEPISVRALNVLFDRRPGPEYIALVDARGGRAGSCGARTTPGRTARCGRSCS